MSNLDNPRNPGDEELEQIMAELNANLDKLAARRQAEDRWVLSGQEPPPMRLVGEPEPETCKPPTSIMSRLIGLFRKAANGDTSGLPKAPRHQSHSRSPSDGPQHGA